VIIMILGQQEQHIKYLPCTQNWRRTYVEGMITFGPGGDQVIKGDFHQSKFLILVANFLYIVDTSSKDHLAVGPSIV